MSDQTDDEQFDLFEALSRRDSALDAVEQAHRTWMSMARAEAWKIANERGVVTADDVRRVLYLRGHKPAHFNAWGAVFRGKEFEWTGEFRRSAVVQGKGNMQRVWRLASETSR